MALLQDILSQLQEMDLAQLNKMLKKDLIQISFGKTQTQKRQRKKETQRATCAK